MKENNSSTLLGLASVCSFMLAVAYSRDFIISMLFIISWISLVSCFYYGGAFDEN